MSTEAKSSGRWALVRVKRTWVPAWLWYAYWWVGIPSWVWPFRQILTRRATNADQRA